MYTFCGSVSICVNVLTTGEYCSHEVTTNTNLAYGTVKHEELDAKGIGGKKLKVDIL